jgi:hypothetical protein
MMPGVDFGEFQEARVDAFDKDGLEILVRVRLNERLDKIATSGTLDYVAFRLLTWAEQQGTPVVVDLARAAYLSRPRNDKLRRIYEKFGMAPKVSCQEAGRALASAPTSWCGCTVPIGASTRAATARPKPTTSRTANYPRPTSSITRTLSGGEQQTLALGRGLMALPRLLIVDEPFLGLAPRVVEQMKSVFEALQAEGIAILFIEQNVRLALSIAGRGYILESGRLARHARLFRKASTNEPVSSEFEPSLWQ